MSCNCPKERAAAAAKQRTVALIKGTVQTVSLPVLRDRRNACRNCPDAEKSPLPKYAKFGGLTNLSKCKKSNKPLVAILKDPEYKCPNGRF